MWDSYRPWLPPNAGHKFAHCNAELYLKSLYKLLKVSSARHAGYIELTSFIVFAKKSWIVKWIENVVLYQRGLEVFKDVKYYVNKEKSTFRKKCHDFLSATVAKLFKHQWCIQSFSGRSVHISNPRRHYHDWRRGGTFSKFLPLNALKMYYLALSVLRFFCKTFCKLLKFIFQNTLPRGWFLKNLYIHKQNLYQLLTSESCKGIWA